MQIDLATATPDVIRADIAIIGAGAAGLTMARAFLTAQRQVALIESGGVDYEKTTSDLNAGKIVGEPYYELEHSRLRFFGGTTAIWGGRCAELDTIDFKERPWVPHSGWPITYDQLRPWYAKARNLLGVAEHSMLAPTWIDQLPFDEIMVDRWTFDRRFDRFGYEASKELIADRNMKLLLHATVHEIVPTQEGDSVSHLEVRGPDGKRLKVEAKTVILAAGGLENPRILLASNKVLQRGVGNQNDLVGRFFMEHPHARGGRVVGGPVWKLLNTFRQGGSIEVASAPLLKLNADLQQKREVLNSALTLAARPQPGGSEIARKRMYLRARHRIEPTKAGRNLWKSYRRAGRAITRLTGPLAPWMAVRRRKLDLAIVIRAEQAPNPNSRVTLDEDTDSLGMPRIRLDWKLQELDVRTASDLIDSMSRDFRRLGLGEVQKSEWLRSSSANWVCDPLISAHPIGGYHHMGTTRMAASPKKGVTDEWGRVHGMSNLFIAGSSLFPTAGWANPTLTILALALRTAGRILERE
ncbi:MAG: FAD-dependent oxidoreductase [Sphingomicrobium sp.]